MPSTWLLAALFALCAWSVQRLLDKVALTTLGTGKFYLLSAIVSLLTYMPYLVLRPPATRELIPAIGLACLMAVTFGVTTEAIRRGPLGVVSPITALSPALTAVLSIALLNERLAIPSYVGVLVAPLGVVILSRAQRDGHHEQDRWLGLALLSFALQGVGAFIAKLVVTPAGPSALLLLSALVQVLVGLFLAPPRRWRPSDLHGRPALFTVFAYVIGGVATISYLAALADGPAAIVVPFGGHEPGPRRSACRLDSAGDDEPAPDCRHRSGTHRGCTPVGQRRCSMSQIKAHAAAASDRAHDRRAAPPRGLGLAELLLWAMEEGRENRQAA